MTPKDPKRLREQIEAQQDEPSEKGYERSAEGETVRTPSKGELFANLRKVAKPSKG